MNFCTAVNCINGRAQTPVIKYLEERFGVDNVDMITEIAANALLAKAEKAAVASILRRVSVSVDQHESVGIAVVGHHGCIGNPGDEASQRKDTQNAVDLLRPLYPQVPVIGLWVDADGHVEEVIPYVHSRACAN